MRKKLALGVATTLGVLFVLVTFWPSATEPPPTEEEWYALQAQRLRNLQVTDEMWRKAISGETTFLSMRSEGLVTFPNGDWTYIVFNSMHTYERYGYQQIKKGETIGNTGPFAGGGCYSSLGQ